MADLSTTKVFGDLTVTNNIKGYTITNLSDVSVVYETRTISAGTGLTGGGALSNNVTLSLTAGFGDTVNPYASKTANWFLAAPNGTAGSPTFRAIVAADVPTLNQSTTGQAGSVANALTMNNSGSGAASGSTYNGSVAVTISYNSVGALSSSTTSTQSGYFGDIYLWDDSTPSHYLQITNSANLTAARILSINVNDANRTISLAGDVTTAGAFTTSGAYALTLTTTAATNVTLPTTGTLATLAGAESLTNKKLGSLTTNGPIYTSNGDGTLNSETTLAASRGGTGVNNSYTLTITGANKTLAGAGGTLTLGASPTINGSGTLALTSNATFTTALTVNTGAVTISGQSGGSTLNLPTSLTVNALTSGHVLYASAANTISGEASLATSRGGTGTTTTLTQGSVVFAGASGVYSQNNANFFWDNSNTRLGISTSSPAFKLETVINPTVKSITSAIAVTSSTYDATDMIGTGTGYVFRQYYYDGSSPAPVTSGRIAVITETNWTSVASTQDSKMIFSTTLGGTLTDRVYINSAGELGVGANESGYKLNVDGAIRTTGNILLQSATPEILFNGTSDAGVDMAIKATPEGLDFYEPEDSNKIHFRILDDTGVDAIYGYSVNSTVIVTSGRVAQNLTWNGSTIAVGYGGTGTATAPTQGGVIYGASATAYASSAAGSAGQVLLSGGTGSPTWTSGTLSIASGKSATFTNSLTVSGADKTFNGAGTSLSIGAAITISALTANHVLYASAANTISGEAQLAATRGGTGYGSYTVGDLLYASSTTALARLNAVAAGSALISAGTSTAPTWGKIDLGTHITGTLGVGSGGTGATSFTTDQILYGNGSNAIASSANLMWASSSFLLTAASSAINNYATSSTALAAPEGVTVTAKNSGAGDGKFAGITFQSANSAGLYSSIYMGVVSTAAGNTSPFVIGRKTGATAYTESLRISESGDVSILSTTTSSAYTSGALLVSGGVGVSGALNANGAMATNSTLTTGNRITVDYSATGGDSTWDKSGILIKNMNGTAAETAIAFQNASTTASNYWIVGLNQSEILKYAYGNSFTDALTLSSLDTNGNFTTTGNIYGASIYLEEDANSTYYLRLFNNSALSANRTLTINVNNTDRSIDMAGNLTVSSTASVSGTNTGDVTLATNSGLAFTSGQTGLALGTPTGLSGASTNSVTTSTHSHAITGAALTKSDDTNVTLTLSGSATTALLNAASITAGWTGQLSLARGGTNANLTASNGGIVYSTGSALAILAGTATASKMLLSGASTTPTWSTSTIPTSAGSTAGKYLVSDGTNYVLSSYTLTLGANTTINTSTANYAAYYSGTNAISGEQYLAVSRGGTGASTFTAGSVVFAGASGVYTQDNSNFFWDDTNNRLGIGTATPISKLQLGSNWVNNPGGGTTSVYLGTAGFAAAYVVPEMIITTSTANTTPATIGLALHNANNTAGAYAPLLVFSKTETGATAYNSSIAAIGARTVTGSGATDSWIDGDLMFYTSPTAGSGLLERMRIAQNGNVGINTISPGFTLEVNGAFAATTKSFIIPHPLKEGKRLCYGSLESPYHGVRLTGRAKVTKGRVTVELPDYLYKLVKEDAVNIQLTNIKHDKVLWVERVDLEHNLFEVGYATKLFDKKEYEFYWDLTAIRKDIPDLQVEI